MKSLVALLMLWGTVACTNEVPVNPDTTQVVTLKNLLPDAKPGYSHAESRTAATSDWVANDELLMKITIDGDSKDYTIYANLICDGTNWKVQESFTTDNLNLLIVPEDGFVLNGNNTGLKVVIPNEIESYSVATAFYYAPDLKWSAVETMVMESTPSTTAPEYWTLTNVGWSTGLARVGIKAAENEEITLSGVSAYDIIVGTNNSFTVTTGTDGMAYFYVKPLSDNMSGFKVKQGTDDILFEASPMNPVTLEAGKSYLIDATTN